MEVTVSLETLTQNSNTTKRESNKKHRWWRFLDNRRYNYVSYQPLSVFRSLDASRLFKL